MVRCFAVVATLLFLASTLARSLTVTQFDMTRDRLEVRHYRGGKYASWVKKNTRADYISVAGFYGEMLVAGQLMRCGVDLTIENSRMKIPSLQRGRKILASYPVDRRICVFPNFATLQQWGRPLWALAGMTVPPDPDRKLARQFWAIKGRHFYHVKMLGSRWQCLRLAKQWGFEAMVHMDGGSSLQPRIRHPSWVIIYRNGLLPKPPRGVGG